jgi:uroporphyrinogen III methyltransferase/synthase
MSSKMHTLKPLLGRTVLVACSEKKRMELAAGLESFGATIYSLPLIELREIEDKRMLDQAISAINKYSWIIFTSAYGVSFFARRLEELEKARSSPMPKICAIGPATAKAAKDSGFEVALMPDKFVAEGIVEALARHVGGLPLIAGHRILLPRAQEAREVLPDALIAAGALVDVVPCYRNVLGEIEDGKLQLLREANPDLIVFTSSSTVRNLVDILGQEDGKKMLQKSIVAVLGPITRSTAQSFGKSAEIVPKESTITSLLEEIYSYYSRCCPIDHRQ